MTTAKRDLHSVFNRRAILISGGAMTMMGAIVTRLAYLQAENLVTDTYTDEARDNRFDQRIIAPPRGVLYDRFGETLAVTSPDYRVTLIPEQVGRKNLEKIIGEIGAILAMPQDAIARKVREANAAKQSDVVIVRQGLRWDEFSAINVRLPELPGVRAESALVRRYPQDIAFAHPIGYVQKPNQREIDAVIAAGDERRAVYLRNPDVRVGKSGLEAHLEDAIHGEAGWRMVEVNAAGRVVNEFGGETRDPKPGRGVVLTIDAECQRAAMERMAGLSGACVVMDVVTGDVITMASSPGFNPNEFVNGISTVRFKELNDDPYKPLFHKAVTGAYSPGSTFKICTGIAALDAGVPTNFRVHCSGYFPFGGRNFHCWKREGHGTVDLHDAMKGSCDVYFYQAALRAGQQRLADTARLLGLGVRYDIGVPSVTPGVVPDEAWWKSKRRDPMPAGIVLNTAIGQGDLLASPLQLAVMMARVANGGLAVTPRLVHEGPGVAPPPTPRQLPINLEASKVVLNGCFGVASEPGGTSYRSTGNLGLWYDPATNAVVEAPTPPPGHLQVQMGGKTGTAQVRVITAAERARGVKSNNQLEWRLRDHALYVCYGPVHKPRYACAVVVEHGGSDEVRFPGTPGYIGGGSAAAAPIAADVMRLVLKKDPSNRQAASVRTLEARNEPAARRPA
ncbi:MAG: penicillin-binding protein 2 [Hyphomonadaceae bacterium]|nr:penicillin-binding protein 2 [Hyphomonadaceae bacterium]